MKISTVSKLAISSLFFSSFVATAADLSAVPSGKYTVDPGHSYINFQYSHLGLSYPVLAFDDFTIDMDLDSSDPTKTSVAVSIEGESILTGSDLFHEHMTGEKWFDIEKYPQLSFTSTGITANSDGTYSLTGDLTVKDVTKPVTLDVTINGAMMHPMAKKPAVGISAEGKLIRSEWGLGASTPFVGDEVSISITAEMLAAQ